MSESQSPPPRRACPRCGTPSDGGPWCEACGLNLRIPFSGERITPLPAASTPFARAWERFTRDPRMLAGTAAAVAVAAVIVAVVFATKSGEGSPGPGLEAAASTAASDVAPSESTPAASTPTETTATTPSVESSQVEQVLNEYQQSYSAENIDGLEAIFAEGLERRDGNRAPENQAAALATYEHQFSQLKNPTYSLSETNVQPGTGEATATARYSISSQNGTVTGSITFHLVEQGEKLLIDKLSISPSK